MWVVILRDEFSEWLDGLSENEQDRILSALKVLEQYGPNLSRPKADTIKGSKLTNLKELCIPYGKDEIRAFYVFDPKRQAIVLCAGYKHNGKTFYKKMIPKAEKLYADYLEELENEEAHNIER